MAFDKLDRFIEKKSVKAYSLPNFDSMQVLGVSNQVGIAITDHKKSKDLSKYQLIEEGDFAYNPYRINVGSIGLVPKGVKGLVSPAYVVFKTKNSLLPELLFDFLKSADGLFQIAKYARGTVRKSLRFNDLCQIEMQIPPIDIQRSILRKKESVQVEINEFKTELTHQQTLLKKLRQQILQEAIEGKLTAEWRQQNPDVEPASELLARIQAEKNQLVKDKKIKKQKPLPPINEEEKPFSLPEGWEWCRIWDVAELITSGSRDWAKYYADEGAIFVTMGNLSKDSYRLRMNKVRYVKAPLNSEGSRTKLQEGDLLISITGDVGNLGVIPKGFGEAYINQHTCMLRYMPECRRQYYLEVMRSPFAKWQYNAPQRGIKNSFRLGDVGEMLLPLPPAKEQYVIAEKVKYLTSLCDQLEAQITDNQTHAEQLMQAVLREAFSHSSGQQNQEAVNA
ncbi:hypothetical protein MTBBW1_1680032 [Desulfamplus magnetovallimortis]|uniref:Type I restriction modification DNA specificity domain-containing protein n=1 Tax=Desulfamplus magnetovallimortis TaxID=1246637 RepID=A0A1W1H9F2_9BACT|nr:restriction endonuclease subunit S [Desulfamplus magnetovallimortis]SLM29120.1 hypothetical protein MTBBW1_1680032 [Desulfamplus magnetovallimortis]